MKKIRKITSYLAPVVTFALILLAMNGYQYFKLKTDFAAGIVREVSDREMQELHTFFETIEQKLRMLRDWGKNDVLFGGDIVSLNKKLIPMLDHQELVSSIAIASETGQEFFLYKDQLNYISRTTTPGQNSSTLHYQQWTAMDILGRSWEEVSDYDPRNRPWFAIAKDEQTVNWTEVYRFFHSKELGLTASISWTTDDENPRSTVLAMDVPLTQITTILTAGRGSRPGVLLLVKGDGKSFIATDSGVDQPPPDQLESDRNLILEKLIHKWRTDGNPDNELVRVKKDNIYWLASFQRINHDGRHFWLGLAAPEGEILGILNQEIFSTDIIEFGIAASGGLFILLLLWRGGLFRRTEEEEVAPIVKLNSYINNGEGVGVEFKSTIRTNLKTGKYGKEIELAWLKAVVAFLNTSGGSVLLGVNDSGEVCGIAADGFENSDRCLLHVKNLINQHIGAEFSTFFQITIVDCEEKQVVMVECSPAGRAVFLKIGKNEEFYVRSGPSSTKLSLSQTVSFVQQNNR
ncbi:MAG: RNA-binding domain-containing protein [Desulforhopalus sp.]